MKGKDLISVARSTLLLDQPFFGVLSLRLELEEMPFIPTCGVDGKKFYFNPSFIQSLKEAELIGVVAHEIMHCAVGHIFRKGDRDHERWNIAADYAINLILLESGFTLPDGALIDKKWSGMSAEEIYENLPKQSGKGGKSKSSEGDGTFIDVGGTGCFLPAGQQGDSATKDTESEWKAATVQAAQLSRGKLPESIKRLVDEILDPKIPWYTELRDFVMLTARNDYNWNRPNRRFLGSGFVLPSLISEELPEVVIVVDTSGSIGPKELEAFSAEASAVLGAYDTTVRVLYADAAVAGEEIFTRADMPMQLHPVGGGGTDFRPAFEYVNKNGITPCCLIYLTDMEGTFPSYAPDYPVLWVATTDIKGPFGRTIKLN